LASAGSQWWRHEGVINLMEDVMKSNKNAKSKTIGKQSRPAKPALA
jgi:hypothetical protein